MRQTLIYYFNFEGRMSRSQFWLKFQLPALILCILGTALFILEYPHFFDLLTFSRPDPNMTPEQFEALILQPVDNPLIQFLGGLYQLVQLGVVISIMSANVRRFHDRDKTGWWVLIGLIPIIGSLWLLIEVGFLKGTEGPNRFGPDPVGAVG